uniref:Uncharacterized protein n=1 Tax=Globisporangium ultimum (strain ATCC 200006 / CBS 805.95 / DAOM BR144) TaxID=431595 RepID=K3X379_GLOUD
MPLPNYQQRAVQIAAESMTALFAASSAAPATPVAPGYRSVGSSPCASPASLSAFGTTPRGDGDDDDASAAKKIEPRIKLPSLKRKLGVTAVTSTPLDTQPKKSRKTTPIKPLRPVTAVNVSEDAAAESDAASVSSSSSGADLTSTGAAAATSELNDNGDEITASQETKKPKRKVRIRKPTYAVRKEEKDVLLKELQTLQAQVTFLKERAGIPDLSRHRDLEARLQCNEAMREALREQQLGLANAQSAVHECLNAQLVNPLASYIHLGREWHERRATLLALKDRKLQDAYDYIQARMRTLDPLKPHMTDDRFENAQGEYCCVRFEMLQFEGVRSVKQVYDALFFYLTNMEVSISEKLGHIPSRDYYDTVDKSISTHRLLSNDCGIELELNGAMFAQYFDAHAPSKGAPCGIVAVDSVDNDDLHPYTPSGRVRKDISACVVLSQHMRKKKDAPHEEELVVVMTRGAFLKLSHAGVEISPQTRLEIRDGIARWGHAMLKCMYDILYPQID